jgi:hypothetical protein
VTVEEQVIVAWIVTNDATLGQAVEHFDLPRTEKQRQRLARCMAAAGYRRQRIATKWARASRAIEDTPEGRLRFSA